MSELHHLPLRVLGDRVLIRPDVEDQVTEQTDSGLYTAPSLAAAVDGSDKTVWYTTGTVVQIGQWPPDAKAVALAYLQTWLNEAYEADRVGFPLGYLRELKARLDELPAQRVRDIQVGDRVAFSVQSGHDVTVNGEPFVIMHDSDVLAVIEPALTDVKTFRHVEYPQYPMEESV